jgi:hypothetical protein
MVAWKSYVDLNTTREILDYYSSFIDKAGTVGKIYPQISDPITITKAIDPTAASSLETLLKEAGTRYLHFTLNQTMMIENIFDTSVASTSVFPNYTISRKSVIYKPTIGANLTATQDNLVVSSDPNNTMAYYKLSLQNRGNISNSPLSPVIPQSKRAYTLNGNKIFTRALLQNNGPYTTATPKLLEGIAPEGVTSNIFQIRSTITDSSFGQNGQELFDISIIRLSELTGDLQQKILYQNLNYISDYSLLVNSSTSNTEANSNTLFNRLINDGIFISPFNVINVTPENNFSEIGVNSKNVQLSSLGSTPQKLTVYSLDGATINNRFGLSNINDLYYPGIPVLEKIDSLSIGFTITDNVTQTKTIKVYCFNGEDLITSAQVNTTQIKQGNYNEIRVTLPNLIPKNYYTYASSYNAGSSLTAPLNNLQFWKFNDPKNLAFAHLSAKKSLGAIQKYNFHIQSLELSIVITY